MLVYRKSFKKGGFPIARCVKAENHDLGVIMADIKVLGLLESKFESRGRVYDVLGCSPTLDTVQGGDKDPKILEASQVLTPKRTEYGKQIRKAYESGQIQESGHNMTELQPREDGISNTLTTVQKDNLLLEKPQYRIRKLTPREYGRLMGVSDEDIDKMAAVNSNTQLYKQFGNSIVVDVMCAMFKNLNINQ